MSSLLHEVVNNHVTGYPTRGVDQIDAALMSVDGLLDELQELQEDVLGIIESMDIALFATSNQPKKRGTLESSATGMAKDSQVWGLATDHDQHGNSVRDETNGGHNQEFEMMPQKSPAMEDFQGNSILSYLPLCSPTGECITHTNQLQVEILSAKELQPLATSKMEDTFCEVEVMNLRALAVNAFESELGLNINVNRGLTYICEKNMNPNWIGQNFIFDVPENAVREKREYKVRVTMRAVSSDSLVQPFDRILGHAEIHFSSLMNEEPVYGWFPLRPHKASITNVENFQTCGSIKLRLRWIHSKTGLARYIAGRLQARLHELHVQQQAQAVMMMEVFTGKGQSMPKTMALQQSGKDSLKEEQAYTDSINTAHSVFATAGLGTSSGIARHGPDEIIPRSGSLDDMATSTIHRKQSFSPESNFSTSESLSVKDSSLSPVSPSAAVMAVAANIAAYRHEATDSTLSRPLSWSNRVMDSGSAVSRGGKRLPDLVTRNGMTPVGPRADTYGDYDQYQLMLAQFLALDTNVDGSPIKSPKRSGQHNKHQSTHTRNSVDDYFRDIENPPFALPSESTEEVPERAMDYTAFSKISLQEMIQVVATVFLAKIALRPLFQIPF